MPDPRLTARTLAAAVLAAVVPLTAQDTRQAASPPSAAVSRARQLCTEARRRIAEGSFAAAHAKLREALAAAAATGANVEPDEVERVLSAISKAAMQYGDLEVADEALARHIASRSARVPATDVPLIGLRAMRVFVKKQRGDLQGAHDDMLGIYRLLRSAYAEDHVEVLRAQCALASVKKGLGDLAGALALEEAAFRVSTKTLAEHHPLLQDLRVNLGNTRYALLDYQGARLLQEQALALDAARLAADDENLQIDRNCLGSTLFQLGDVHRALALWDKAHRVLAKKLPPHHWLRVAVRNNIANARRVLGETQAAHDIYAQAAAELQERYGANHPRVLSTLGNLATARRRLGRLDEARVLHERVVVQLAKSLPSGHPDLVRERCEYGRTQLAAGEFTVALATLAQVVASRERTLGADDPLLVGTRCDLVLAAVGAGQPAAAIEQARAALRGCVRATGAWGRSPRELGIFADKFLVGLERVLTVARGYHGRPPLAGLEADLLLAVESMRGLGTRSARRARVILNSQHRAAADRLLQQVARHSRELARLAGRHPDPADPAAADKWNELRDRQGKALRDKEQAEAALLALARQVVGARAATPTVAALAERLPAAAVAVSIVDYQHRGPLPPGVGSSPDGRGLVAFCLDAKGGVKSCALGATDPVRKAVEVLRSTAMATGRADPQAIAAVDEARRQLGAQVVAPILAAAGSADTIYLSACNTLGLVPLDAALVDGQVAGQRARFVPVVSLLDLLEQPRPAVDRAPALLLVGAVDYDQRGPEQPAAAALTVATGDPPAVPDLTRGGGVRFDSLPGTAAETLAVRGILRAASPDAACKLLAGRSVGKQALLRAVRGMDYVHIATHGYFAPDGPAGAAVRRSAPAQLAAVQFRGLSPLALCGLALSGANLPPDALGYTSGIVTAEELLALDLSACELVTLSACNTSLGVERAGEGYASLRAALQGAGARHVLTSLWKVGDANTRQLMTGFYQHLWKGGSGPHRALWAAKMAARDAGMPFRDWAGWVLTGI